MNLDYSPEDEAFRAEVRAFLGQDYPVELRRRQQEKRELSREDYLLWHRHLAAKGWVAPNWPLEWGGTGWSPTQRYIWADELARVEAAPLVPFGLAMLAPVLWTFGTQEQKRRFLPGIYNGEVWWCQGYSEPGAGSDLANLRTRAERMTDADGQEYYLVNGQKTWTTHAQYADWGFFLVRTDPSCKPQAGISFLLIDMKSPGITVRPITTIEGGCEINDVFLDNVRVPIENRIHDENKGWTCAKALLAYERTALAEVAVCQRRLANLRKVAGSRPGDNGQALLADPFFRRKLTELEIELTALEFTELRALADEEQGRDPGPESSLLKIRGTEIKQRLDELYLEAAGGYGPPFINDLVENAGCIPDQAVGAMGTYLNNRKITIFGGSNEIQRNIIAKVVLGL